jgi:hypothetical protein
MSQGADHREDGPDTSPLVQPIGGVTVRNFVVRNRSDTEIGDVSLRNYELRTVVCITSSCVCCITNYEITNRYPSTAGLVRNVVYEITNCHPPDAGLVRYVLRTTNCYPSNVGLVRNALRNYELLLPCDEGFLNPVDEYAKCVPLASYAGGWSLFQDAAVALRAGEDLQKLTAVGGQ